MGPIAKEVVMKKVSAATAVALFGLAPALGSACEYNDSSAAAQPPTQLATAPAPAASKAPTSTTLIAPVTKRTGKQVVDKSREPATEAKVAVVSSQ
jgi:hypothetical protein